MLVSHGLQEEDVARLAGLAGLQQEMGRWALPLPTMEPSGPTLTALHCTAVSPLQGPDARLPRHPDRGVDTAAGSRLETKLCDLLVQQVGGG